MEFSESLIRMVSALAVVLGLMVMLMLLVRRLAPGHWLGRGQAPLVRVLASGYVGPRKSILLVSVAGDILIVGSTATHLVPLGQVKDPNQVERLLGRRTRAERAPEPEHRAAPQASPLHWLGRAFKVFEDEGVWRVAASPPVQDRMPPPRPPKRARGHGSVGGPGTPNVRLARDPEAGERDAALRVARRRS